VEPVAGHSEREWILIGMAECCAGRGYGATTVDDVCAAAGVSRESFDGLFADKSECLGAAMESIVNDAWRALDGALSPGKPWAEALRDGMAALLESLAGRPAFAHVALIESTTAEGRARVLRESSKAALLDFLERGRGQTDTPDVPAIAARGALAGAEALVVGQILEGKGKRLGELVPDVVYMLAVPFLGVGEAGRLAHGAGRRRHLRAVA
jgi:AcrR family transcriptional regulator